MLTSMVRACFLSFLFLSEVVSRYDSDLSEDNKIYSKLGDVGWPRVD